MEDTPEPMQLGRAHVSERAPTLHRHAVVLLLLPTQPPSVPLSEEAIVISGGMS